MTGHACLPCGYRLLTARSQHGMDLGQDGHIYIAGGGNLSHSGHVYAITVERLDLCQSTCHMAGSLMADVEWNIRCHHLASSDDILVVGTMDKHGCTVLQVYSPQSQDVQYHLSLGRHLGWVCGIVQTDTHVIFVGDGVTVTVSIPELLSRKPQTAVFCHRYGSPNQGCAVTLTSQGDMLLVGGQHRINATTVYHSVYRAAVQDVVNNVRPGWRPLATECTLEESFICGYCTHSMRFKEKKVA